MDERLVRILELLGPDPGPAGPRLCQVAAQVSGADGAGIMLLIDGRPQASLCSTNSVSALIEEIQYTLGEGPCVDAHRLGETVAEPDLAASGASRWPAFSPRALDAGARAVFGFPIRVATTGVGALNLYRDRSGSLLGDQHADAVVLAGLAGRSILAAQADAGPGRLGADLDSDSHLWAIVHQAAGMVSTQLDITVEEALARLRAHAFGTDRVVSEVARDVVERRLRFDPNT